MCEEGEGKRGPLGKIVTRDELHTNHAKRRRQGVQRSLTSMNTKSDNEGRRKEKTKGGSCDASVLIWLEPIASSRLLS